MRFKVRKRQSVDLTDWHDWFAWYPVRVSTMNYAWLEVVRRRGTHEGARFSSTGPGDVWKFEYMPKEWDRKE